MLSNTYWYILILRVNILILRGKIWDKTILPVQNQTLAGSTPNPVSPGRASGVVICGANIRDSHIPPAGTPTASSFSLEARLALFLNSSSL